ncbi:hypothetical protein [Alienimonas sp. DA493]|uniref:hypothetical protein n=1 Tax=Alienimonas sp. DA493 TaxID=3373605 RepID=UPI003754C704
MKALLAAAVVLLILGLLGWFTLYSNGSGVGVNMNEETIAEDVDQAADAVGSGVDKVKEEADKVSVDVDVDRE